MPALLTPPLETLTTADVQSLMDWPGSMTVEFKREIPGQNGQPDPWVAGGKAVDYGRDKLFKEIVALANTAGGHLIVGVDEDKGSCLAGATC